MRLFTFSTSLSDSYVTIPFQKVNDGLVSTFLLVAGVVGGGLATKDILLTAISGSLAGAVRYV